MLKNILALLFTQGRFSAWVRHGLTFLAGVLVAKGLLTTEQAASIVTVLHEAIASPEVWAGIFAFVTGLFASKKSHEG